MNQTNLDEIKERIKNRKLYQETHSAICDGKLIEEELHNLLLRIGEALVNSNFVK